MRSIALDIHRDFCEVAIKEGGEVRLRGRIKTSTEELELFARSLAPDDQVALEATGPADRIARILEPHVARVVVANTRKVRAIAESKVKTDKVDAQTLCELLDAGFLPAVWRPDEPTRALRALLGRRERMVRSRTRAKNAVHAALQRNLKGRPPMTDVFGVAGAALAGGARAAGTRAPDRRELPARGRLPLQRDRLAGARAGPPGALIGGDPPADERPRGEPRLGGHLRRGGGRHRPLFLAQEARRLRRA